MNSTVFRLSISAYWNHSSAGTTNIFDSQGNLAVSLKDDFTNNLGLGAYWFSDSDKFGEAIGLFILFDVFLSLRINADRSSLA